MLPAYSPFYEVISMAEFCVKCFQKYFDADAKESDLTVSADLDLCEGCATYKHVVVGYKKKSVIQMLKYILKH